MSWRYDSTTTSSSTTTPSATHGPAGEQAETADQQDHQQLLRRVRHGRERVAREDREREVLREQLALELVGRERFADQPVA